MNHDNGSARRRCPRRGLARLSGILRLLPVLAGATLLVGVLVLVGFDVVQRNVTGRGVPGAVEYAELALAALIYLGLPYVHRKWQQIQVDAVVNLLPDRLARVTDVVASTIVAGLVLWFLWGTSVSFLESLRQGEMRFGLARVAVWPARAAIAVGFAALLVEVLISLGRLLMGSVSSPGEAGS